MEIPEANTSPDGSKQADGGILQLANSIAEKHAGTGDGPPKRGRGRPPTHGKYSQKFNPVPPVSVEENAGENPPGSDNVGGEDSGFGGVTLDPEMVVELSRILWDGANEALRNSLRDRAARLPAEIKEDVKEMISSAGFSPAQTEALAKMTPLILQEWGISSMASPTAAAGLLCGVAALSWWRTAKALERMAEKGRENG